MNTTDFFFLSLILHYRFVLSATNSCSCRSLEASENSNLLIFVFLHGYKPKQQNITKVLKLEANTCVIFTL